MQAHQPAIVIAIAGPSGAGKTSLVQRVAALLDQATQVYFDDYPIASVPADMPAWLASGADPNEWSTPQLTRDLQALRQGQEAVHPDGTTVLRPTRYIVIEEPFGRERRDMAALIDLAVVIDLPLEIALARRIRRTIQIGTEQRGAEQTLHDIEGHLQFYLAFGSRLYATVNARALSSCDLAVDGRLPTEQLAEQVAGFARTRYAAI